ncbi:MAG: hypothetical protein ABII09_01430 [Planctomycetota bacterium]
MFYLAAGDNEETFWIQLLVIVILAAGIGIFGVIKKHRVRYGSAGELIGRTLNGLVRHTSEIRQALIQAVHRVTGIIGDSYLFFNKILLKTIANREKIGISPLKPATRPNTPKSGRPAKQSKRDFNSGMELLTGDFLVEVVERTGSVEMRDVTMRNLCFTELVRRGELGAVSSDALKTYTLNTEGVFDKSIRYQAMKELASRTARAAQPTANEAAAGKTD